MADDDDLADELLLVAGRGTVAAGKKRGRHASEESEEEWADSQDEEAPRSNKKAAGGSRRKGKAVEQPAEESDEESSEGDALTEADMVGLSELDREMLIYEREQAKLKRREMKQLLKKSAKGNDQSVEVRASSRRAKSTTGKESAIGKLAAAREQREARAQQHKEQQQQKGARGGVWDEDAELSSDEAPLESEEEGVLGEEGVTRERYDDASDDEEDAMNERAELADLQSIQLKRHTLEAWHAEPYFTTSVVGAFVRYAFGDYRDAAGQVHPNYLIMRVTDVVDKAPYRFGAQPADGSGARTSKWLVLEEAGLSKSMMMQQVSNAAFTEEEYQRYLRHNERAHVPPITKADVTGVREQLAAAHNYKYTEADIRKRVADKRGRGGAVLGTFAAEKARLELQLARAKQEEEVDEAAVAKLEEQLEQLLVRFQARVAASGTVNLSEVNARNKAANLQTTVNSGKAKATQAADADADVFSRRQTRSKVYWNTTKRRGGDADGATPPPDGALAPSQGATPPPADSALPASQSEVSQEPTEVLQRLDLDVDLSRLPDGPAAAAARRLTRRMLGPKWAESLAMDLNGKTLLSFSDWKARMSSLAGGP